jgi:hypothetical protein
MGGGLMQLVAYGAQDIYLTGNPQITFFKVVYRRHTNFAMESIEQTFNGSVGAGNRVTATISRNGDLVHRMWLQASVKNVDAGNNDAALANSGHSAIDNVELEIGGQRIDKQYGDWLEAWSQLTLSEGHLAGYKTMVGTNGSTDALDLYIPLQFWFCRNPGLALPLIALQYHEVKVNLTFGSVTAVNSASLWVDYIYLDTDERRRFAQVSHEYLIEQVQFTGDEALSTGTNNVRLNFNHPVKELVWVSYKTNETLVAGKSYQAMDGTAKLQLNGHDRMAARPAAYFKQVQPYQHHTRIPAGEVNVYSFALKPEEHQPSGTCNFSRIDNATLSVSVAAAGTLKVFAVNYNVLRVMSGMGGLAYSN